MAPLPGSIPPPPLLEPLISAGAFHRTRDELDEALDAYKKALMLAEGTDPSVLASIYAHIGAIKRAQGKIREAELNYEKALAASPTHRRSLEELISMATEEKDYTRAVGWRRKVAALLTDPGEKADELARIATTLADEAGDLRGAAEALEHARKLRPDDAAVVLRLSELYVKLGDEARTVGLVESRILQEDITSDGWLPLVDELADLRARRNEWRQLNAFYTRLVDHCAARGRVDRAAEVCRRLGVVRRDRLADLEGAIDAFSGALRCRPSDVQVRAALADLFVATGDRLAALDELETAASFAPRRQQTYRTLFELHRHEGRTDRAWLAAMALEQLDAAEVDHTLIANQYRPDAPIRPVSALDDAAWDNFLRAPGFDPVVAEILRAVGPAAIAARVEELAKEKKLVELDPAKKQPETSTVSIVRSFVWASSVLGVPAPAMYPFDDVPGGIAAVPGAQPATVFGPEATSGLSLQELAFLAGRHLTYYRPEHYPLVFFPTLAELSALFLAAVKVVLTDLPLPPGAAGGDAVARRSKELARRLDAEAKEALADGVHAFDHAGGRADLGGFIRAVELGACRAGLVLCGDLAVAARLLRREERGVGELTADDRLDDLLAFCARPGLAVLREWLGVAARPSMRPPAVR